jgi:hypothetical protein
MDSQEVRDEIKGLSTPAKKFLHEFISDILQDKRGPVDLCSDDVDVKELCMNNKLTIIERWSLLVEELLWR